MVRYIHIEAISIPLIGFLLASCATSALWDKTDPQEPVAVSQESISEAEVKETGREYQRDDANKLYYVEKSTLLKFRDYAFRALLTPVTVAIDAVVVVGAVGIIGYAMGRTTEYDRDYQEKFQLQEEYRKQQEFRRWEKDSKDSPY